MRLNGVYGTGNGVNLISAHWSCVSLFIKAIRVMGLWSEIRVRMERRSQKRGYSQDQIRKCMTLNFSSSWCHSERGRGDEKIRPL